MANLLPVIKQRFVDANGDPLDSGLVYTYQAGTSTPMATYQDKDATTENTNPIQLNANGEADIWIGPGYYKFVIADADDVIQFTVDDISLPTAGAATNVPTGGLTGQVLTKTSDGDYAMTWSDAGGFDPSTYGYDEFSARYGAQVTTADLDETLRYIFQFQYVAPTISLSASGNSLREKGAAVTSSTLTAAITKKSDPIAEVKFYLNPSTLLDTQTSGGAIPSGGNSTYAWTGSFSDNTTFRATVTDNGATGGPTTVTSTTTFSFVYPYYSGAGAVGLSAAAVGALTKSIIASTATVSKTITTTAGQVLYFAYPASYGALTSILDVNGFETISDWTLTTSNITGLDASAVSYRIYEFNNPLGAGSNTYTFKR